MFHRPDFQNWGFMKAESIIMSPFTTGEGSEKARFCATAGPRRSQMKNEKKGKSRVGEGKSMWPQARKRCTISKNGNNGAQTCLNLAL